MSLHIHIAVSSFPNAQPVGNTGSQSINSSQARNTCLSMACRVRLLTVRNNSQFSFISSPLLILSCLCYSVVKFLNKSTLYKQSKPYVKDLARMVIRLLIV